jgi:hypothetical protein
LLETGSFYFALTGRKPGLPVGVLTFSNAAPVSLFLAETFAAGTAALARPVTVPSISQPKPN